MSGVIGRSGGRNRKPSALRALQGNPGKRALPKNEPQPAIGAPPPTWLTRPERTCWSELAPMLTRLGILGESDAHALGFYCVLFVEFLKRKRAGKLDKDLARLCTGLLSQFGLTPASRGRVEAATAQRPSLLDRYRKPESAGWVPAELQDASLDREG